jgi:hypothetical protein
MNHLTQVFSRFVWKSSDQRYRRFDFMLIGASDSLPGINEI